MNTAILLSIRDKAKRFPGKVRKLLHGKTATEQLLVRLKTAKQPDKVILCTSDHPNDSVLCDLATESGITFFRGSQDDKLDRYLQCARAEHLEFVVIVDGDDILCAAEYIDEAIHRFRETKADFITQLGLPLGAASFGVKVAALETVCANKAENDTEVWGGYFTGNDRFHVEYIDVEDPLMRRPDVRMTLDYPEDYEFFRTVFDALGPDGRVFSFKEVMKFLECHPEVVEINRGVQSLYEAHLKKAAAVQWKEPKAKS